MEIIISNCDSMFFLGGKEKTTLEEISKMLGKETIDMYNTTITKGTQESHGQNFQKLGKDLMNVYELAVLDGAKCILQIRGECPFLPRKYLSIRQSQKLNIGFHCHANFAAAVWLC